MGKKKWTGPNERKKHHQRKGGHQKRPFGNKRRDGPRKPFEGRTKNNPEKRVQEDRNPKTGLIEKDVGITQFIGTAPGFLGVIKARFSDFQVNEIDQDGNEVRLTDQNVPKPPETDVANSEENERAVIELISVENWDRVVQLSKSDPKAKEFIEVDVDHLTKEQRSLIHTTLKEIYGKALVGTTQLKNGKKHIKWTRFVKGESDSRTKWVWPGEYTYFVLHKENVDTMKAAADLANAMNTNVSSFTYAGTKDKRGKTTQLFCIRKREPEKIIRAASRFNQFHVGNFTFKQDPLKLGSLKGNRFRIALRHITAEAETINLSLTSLRENGFVNYYGLQRFGNCLEIPTHTIGMALLRGQFEEAVQLILMPRDGDADFMHKVREHWWKHRDAEAALKMLFKTNTGVEAKLLAGLAKNGPNDYVNALANIPRNMRLMYIHAYQSLIWNEMASKRIELGLEPLVGDLVYVDKVSETVDLGTDPAESVLADDDDDADPEIETSDAVEEVSRFRTMVRPLTVEDIASEKYQIFDIVLPLPGHDITYPSNECAKWYEERLARDRLSSELLKQKQKAYSLTGAYRKLVVRPEKLSWELFRYNNDTDNLIQSDYDQLKCVPKPEPIEDGAFTALLVDFRLPSSTYATMVLREILKVDTSPANQTKLNKIAAAAATAATVDENGDDKNDDDNDDENEDKECEEAVADGQDKLETAKDRVDEETSVGEKRKLEDNDQNEHVVKIQKL